MKPLNVIELAQSLVRIPSVNPDGDAGTPHTGEKACAEFVGAWCRDLGAEVEFHEVLPDRPNIVARFPSKVPGKKRLLLAPHTDTVSVVGMTIDPFSGELREGRIWGRGASDTKGPMAAMLWALKESRDCLAELPYEIWFAGLMGEEAGLHGSRALAERMPFDFVIVGEPTDLQTVNSHKGQAWFHLTTAGKACHASQPERGENAIYKMTEVVAFIRKEMEPQLRQQTHPVLGHSTASVGIIRGGSKTNIVPDFCELQVDCRIVPGYHADGMLEQLRTHFPDLQIRLTQSNPLDTPADHPLVQFLNQTGAPCAGAPWFCDAAAFAAKGVPGVALGPGSIQQAHTADEWISVDDLEAGAEFFKNFLNRLAAR